MRDPTPEEDALASKLVDDALEGFDAFLGPRDLELIRALLESELVATTEGRRQLRACMPDPAVAKSDDVPLRGDAAIATPRKASSEE